VIAALGLAQLVSGPARGIGPTGYALGALFLGIGVARLWLLHARRS
jgi:hypothetical protein